MARQMVNDSEQVVVFEWLSSTKRYNDVIQLIEGIKVEGGYSSRHPAQHDMTTQAVTGLFL